MHDIRTRHHASPLQASRNPGGPAGWRHAPGRPAAGRALHGCNPRMISGKGLFLAALLAGTAQAAPVGIFSDFTDVGAVSRPTTASYDPDTGTYSIGASGDNIWAERDSFGFLWKQSRGDLELGARVEIQGESSQEHRKAGLMLRQSLAPDSAYVDVVIHGNGLTSLQFRSETGHARGAMCAAGASAARLEKRGDYVLLLLAKSRQIRTHGVLDQTSLRGLLLRGTRGLRARQPCFRSRPVPACIARPAAGAKRDPDISPRSHAARFTGSTDRLSNHRAAGLPEFHRGKRRSMFPRRRAHVLLQPDGEFRSAAGGAENVEDCVLARPVRPHAGMCRRKSKAAVRSCSGGESGNDKAKPFQLTKDSYSNWTPRLSPDGQTIVFASGSTPTRTWQARHGRRRSPAPDPDRRGRAA